jgi:hypothetical protein
MQIGDQTKQDLSSQLPVVSIGRLNKNASDGAGTDAITGIGFRPSHVHFYMAQGGANSEVSIGVDNGVNAMAVNSTSSTAWAEDAFHSLRLHDGVNVYDGTITSIQDDGFTITWVVTAGTPAGLAPLHWVAYK